MSELLTIGDLRKLIGKPAYTINYAIEQHGPAPVGRVGIARVWSRDQLEEIQESVRRTTGSPLAAEAAT